MNSYIYLKSINREIEYISIDRYYEENELEDKLYKCLIANKNNFTNIIICYSNFCKTYKKEYYISEKGNMCHNMLELYTDRHFKDIDISLIDFSILVYMKYRFNKEDIMREIKMLTESVGEAHYYLHKYDEFVKNDWISKRSNFKSRELQCLQKLLGEKLLCMEEVSDLDGVSCAVYESDPYEENNFAIQIREYQESDIVEFLIYAPIHPVHLLALLSGYLQITRLAWLWQTA